MDGSVVKWHMREACDVGRGVVDPLLMAATDISSKDGMYPNSHSGRRGAVVIDQARARRTEACSRSASVNAILNASPAPPDPSCPTTMRLLRESLSVWVT
jgi:hypothetical protein